MRRQQALISIGLILLGLFCVIASLLYAGTPDPINSFPQTGGGFFTQLTTYLRNEISQERSEQGLGANFVVSGCIGSAGPGLAHTPTQCIAYANGYRVLEGGSISYPPSLTCQAILNELTVGNVTGPDARLWTRIPGTHYLITCAVGSSFPVNTVPLMQVITGASSITGVADIRALAPINSYAPNLAHQIGPNTVGSLAILDGSIVPQKIFTGSTVNASVVKTGSGFDCSGTGWDGVSESGFRTADTISITTRGGPILVMANGEADYVWTVDNTPAGSATTYLKLRRDWNGSTGNIGPVFNPRLLFFTAATFQIPTEIPWSFPMMWLDLNVPAGTHSYTLVCASRSDVEHVAPTLRSWSFIVMELS